MLKIIVSIIHLSLVSIHTLCFVLLYLAFAWYPKCQSHYASLKKYLESLHTLIRFQITRNNRQFSQCSVCVCEV